MMSRETLSVRVPFRIRKHGGRKLMVSPDGASAPARPRIDSTLIKALARAHRWRRFLETGTYTTVEEIAAAETINASYVSRILRLTLLAPDLAEAILDGRQPAEVTLSRLLKPFPVEWAAQHRDFAGAR